MGGGSGKEGIFLFCQKVLSLEKSTHMGHSWHQQRGEKEEIERRKRRERERKKEREREREDIRRRQKFVLCKYQSAVCKD